MEPELLPELGLEVYINQQYKALHLKLDAMLCIYLEWEKSLHQITDLFKIYLF